jgi:hypothetical protein
MSLVLGFVMDEEEEGRRENERKQEADEKGRIKRGI